jgi:hypothetical protein
MKFHTVFVEGTLKSDQTKFFVCDHRPRANVLWEAKEEEIFYHMRI